jgi:hypothetical protein
MDGGRTVCLNIAECCLVLLVNLHTAMWQLLLLPHHAKPIPVDYLLGVEVPHTPMAAFLYGDGSFGREQLECQPLLRG